MNVILGKNDFSIFNKKIPIFTELLDQLYSIFIAFMTYSYLPLSN